MPLKFCKKCEFWLTVLTLSQLGLLYVMMSKFYSQLEGGGILKKLVIFQEWWWSKQFLVGFETWFSNIDLPPYSF